METRHNCLAGEHYPKQIPTRWTDEKGKPSNLNTSIIMHAMTVCTLGIIFSWFAFVMNTNDMPIDELPIWDIDKYKEHIKILSQEIKDASCEQIAVNIVNDVYSNRGLVSDLYMVELEYGYKCLGIERPDYPLSKPFADNPRGR